MTVGATKKTVTKKATTKKAAAKKSATRKNAATKKIARKKTNTKKTASNKSASEGSRPPDAAQTPLEIDEYRQRLGAVGRLMRAALADLEGEAPVDDRIGRGAYLQVMGRAFEVLDGLSQSVEVDDLVKISKVVAEQRRAELNHRKLQIVGDAAEARSKRSRAGSNSDEGTDDCTLPKSFGKIVRQIYGTTLAADLNGAGRAMSDSK
jgi:hypothetical protein